jgi:hypothetical protein
MKSFQIPLRIATAFGAALLIGPSAESQVPPVNLNQRASSAANATQRVRAQVQQNVQQQVQQQVQAQAQQRVQAQTQQRIQSQTELRLPAAGSARLNANLEAKARVDLGAETKAKAGANASQAARGGQSGGIPVRLTAEEMVNLDVVFGEFNPFRQREQARSSEAADRGEARGESETRVSGSADSGRGRENRPVRLMFESEAEFQAALTAAVRQRRAEISSMRDQALSEVDERKMALADRLESLMEAYVAAEAKANADTNSAINTNPFTRRAGSAVIQAGAEGESQTQIETSEGSSAPGETTSPEESTSPE